MNNTKTQIESLQKALAQKVIGQNELVRKMILVLLADGNLLLEGMPGLAKTRAIKSLANILDCGFSRIQFTPDLLPSDITGTEIYEPESKEKFIFQKGPIFSNLVLADEINRAPAKVQSALLEAMEERQVSVAGKTYKMDPLFMVMATQNPVEQEGTYPLPEAQMDRFLMHVVIDYPDTISEIEILRLNRNELTSSAEGVQQTDPNVVFEARKEIQKITISPAMEQYIVDLVAATRRPEKYDETWAKWINFGASPRGTIAIDRAARTHAWMNGQKAVGVDNIRAVLHDCLRHRIGLSYDAAIQNVSANQVIDELLTMVAVIA